MFLKSFLVFKYNFCFSSTIHFFVYFTWQWDLNTTFVSLQPDEEESKTVQFILFKYNFCFSSTVIHLQVNQANLNLNTTFVSLQRYILVFLTHPISDLNTTFVSLQPDEEESKTVQFILFKYNFCFSSTVIQVCTSGE